MKQRLNICENRKIDIVREKNRQLEKKNIQKDWVTCLKKIKAAEKELKKVNTEIDKVLNKKD